MFCNQCGNTLAEGSQFCPNCGASVTSAPTVEKSKPTAKKAGKKKTPVWLTIVIVLAAFLLGKFVIAPSMLSEPESSNPDSQIQENLSSELETEGDIAIDLPQENPVPETEADINVSNAAYDTILTEAYIVHFQPFFMMDTESFVLKQEDGIICCADYGYEDDVVKQWVETMYIPVSDYSDQQKAELEATMKTEFESLDVLGFCSVEFNMGTNYLTITCTYTDVDKADNYTALYNAGLLGANTFISMSATSESLVSQGFIQK